MQITIKIISGKAAGKCLSFKEADCFLFGRSADARVSLPEDPYVSRHHFLLEIAPPECKITDLGSKNGTFVNNVRYGGRRPLSPGYKMAPQGALGVRLHDGDIIAVGDTVFKIHIKVDVPCALCGSGISDEVLPTTPGDDGRYLCEPCRRQATASEFQGTSIATLTEVARHISKDVHCICCHKDVTDKPGIQGLFAEAEYLCTACRNQQGNDLSKLLLGLLQAANLKSSLPELPSLEGYTIDDELGRGGMGVVFKAIEQETGRTVAVKMMLPRAAVNAQNVRVFQREIEITRQLRHPNIVQLYDHGKAAGTFFFILEFVEGISLDRLIRSKGGFLSLEQAAPIMLGITEGLAYAHGVNLKAQIAGGKEMRFTGVVHRDLKPQNVLLSRNGNQWIPKIADFGLSKSFESAGLTDMTVPGQIAGTPVYWPREQITHYRFLSPATDVFSMAAAFYETLTGFWVRDGYEEMFEMCAHREKAPEISDFMRVIAENPTIPIRRRLKSIPGPVAEVMDRALREAEIPSSISKMRVALDRLRYPDAGAFQQALIRAFENSGLQI